MNSAIATASFSAAFALAAAYNAAMESGEFIVMVAAVEIPSHDGRPSFRAEASSWILW